MSEEKTLYEKLTEQFPHEAFQVDDSRGFVLIGIKSAFVIERMNEVFGVLGNGWRFAHSPFEEHGKEVVVEVIIQYRVGEGGTWPYNYDTRLGGFVPHVLYHEDGKPDYLSAVWSHPISGVGGNRVGSGGVPMSDARKSAVSSALSKATSRLGIGVQAYKGQLRREGQQVVVVGESSNQMAEEMSGAASFALGYLLRSDPGKYDNLRATNSYVSSYHTNLVGALVKKIKDANLAEFVSENLGAIVGDKKRNKLNLLTAGQLLFVSDMVSSIASGKMGWETALAFAKKWDRESTWAALLEATEVAEDDQGAD